MLVAGLVCVLLGALIHLDHCCSVGPPPLSVSLCACLVTYQHPQADQEQGHGRCQGSWALQAGGKNLRGSGRGYYSFSIQCDDKEEVIGRKAWSGGVCVGLRC